MANKTQKERERISVTIPAESYDTLTAYCGIKGQPQAAVIEEALVDWLDTIAQGRIEVFLEATAPGTPSSAGWVIN